MITNFYELKRVFGTTKASVLVASANDIGVNSMLMVRHGKDAPQKHWSIRSLIGVCEYRLQNGTHRTDKAFYIQAKKKLEGMI